MDRKAAALTKFVKAEEDCRLTNACFNAWNRGVFQFPPDVEAVLHGAMRKISETFGDAPSLDDLRPRFGPGSNTSVPKRMASIWKKLQKVPHCSEDSALLASELLNGFNGYGPDNSTVNVEIRRGKLSFVLKNANEDRITVTEPGLTGVWQLGLGDYMARPLERVGISIRDQSANQRAALYGSISGESATLDMTSASDTNACMLVHHLWSDDWCELFFALRTSRIELDGENIPRLEKISSMGNGFTFPLETAMFWALAQAAKDLWAPKSRVRVLVYGDDIIVPSSIAVRFMRVLRSLGYTPNEKKSFWTGNFRESCGCDYVSGTNVRPFYLKGNESEDDGAPWALSVSDLFRIHNFYANRGLHELAQSVRSCIPRKIRLTGPKGYGDGYLHSNVWVARTTRKGWGGYTFVTWGFAPRVAPSSKVREIHDITTVRWAAWKPQVEQTFRKRKVIYHAHALHHVSRVAFYAAYLREEAQSTVVMTAGVHNALEPNWPEAAPFVGPLQTPWHFQRDTCNNQTTSGLVPPRQYFLGLGKALERFYPATASDGDAPHVIPGKGELRRTKVYTFETPLMAKQA